MNASRSWSGSRQYHTENFTTQSARREPPIHANGCFAMMSSGNGKATLRRSFCGSRVLVSSITLISFRLACLDDRGHLSLTVSAGAGKTFLTSKVIDHVQCKLQASPSHEGFAFFYCNRNEPERRQPLSVLRSYVRQLPSTEYLAFSALTHLVLLRKLDTQQSRKPDGMTACISVLAVYCYQVVGCRAGIEYSWKERHSLYTSGEPGFRRVTESWCSTRDAAWRLTVRSLTARA